MSEAGDLRRLSETLALSAAVVAAEPAELAGQLVGRLLGAEGEGVRRVVGQAQGWDAQPWLRPLAASLSPPGGPLRHVLAAHVDAVARVASSAPDLSPGMMGPIESLSISGDGGIVVSGALDGSIRTWDLASGSQRWAWDSPPGSVQRVAAQPDGSRIGAALEPGPWLIWDLAGGVPEPAGEAQGSVLHLSLSPEGLCAVVRRDERLWLSCSHLNEVVLLGDQDGQAAAIAPGCSRVVTVAGDEVWIWDAEGTAVGGPLLGHGDTISGLAVTPDGRRAVTASRDKTLIVWDIERGAMLTTLIGHTGFVLDVSAGAGERGGRGVSTSSDRTVRMWDLDEGEPLGVLDAPVSFPRAVVSADAGTAVSSTPEGELRVWDLDAWESSAGLESTSDLVNLVAVTPGCTRAVAVYHVGSIRRWDLEPYERSGTPVGNSGIAGVWTVEITPDGRQAVLGGWSPEIEVWDLDERALVQRFETPHEKIRSLAVGPGGRLLSTDDETLVASDLRTGRLLLQVALPGGGRLVTTRGEDRVLLAGDGRLEAVDLEQPVARTELLSAETVVPAADGRFALAGSGEDWSLVSLDESARRTRLAPRLHAPTSVTVLPETGRVIATSRGTLVAWSLETGAHLLTARFGGDLRPWFSWVVSADGTTVAATDNAGTTHFLRLTAEPGSDTWRSTGTQSVS